jgi:hypothetical protein
MVTFDRIERPAICALEISTELSEPLMCAHSYLNMAELKWLQKEFEISLKFWEEAKE